MVLRLRTARATCVSLHVYNWSRDQIGSCNPKPSCCPGVAAEAGKCDSELQQLQVPLHQSPCAHNVSTDQVQRKTCSRYRLGPYGPFLLGSSSYVTRLPRAPCPTLPLDSAQWPPCVLVHIATRSKTPITLSRASIQPYSTPWVTSTHPFEPAVCERAPQIRHSLAAPAWCPYGLWLGQATARSRHSI